MKERRRMLHSRGLTSRSKTRIPDQFMESELAKRIYKVIVSIGKNTEKFFVTNRIEWKPKKVIDLYLRRWDIEVFHREMKQDGLRNLYQWTHESLLGTAKLCILGDLLLEISAIRSLETHPKIGKGTPGMRFRSMAMGILVDRLKAMEKGGKEFLEALLASIGKSYRSTMASLGD